MKFITKKKKLDRRFKRTRFVRNFIDTSVCFIHFVKTKEFRAALVAGLLFGSMLGLALFAPKETSPLTLGKIIKTKAIEVSKLEKKDWEKDLIGYFRYKGKEIGYDDYDITKLHQVMDCENGTHDPKRKNYKYDGESGMYTAAGFAMITNSTWAQNKCKGNKFDGTDNIDCFYKIIGNNNGLGDYRESKGCWSKKFNVNDIYFIK